MIIFCKEMMIIYLEIISSHTEKENIEMSFYTCFYTRFTYYLEMYFCVSILNSLLKTADLTPWIHG